MLDKSVSYYPIIMRRDPGAAPEYVLLPEGFRLTTWQPGMEQDWARIEAAVGEFNSTVDALSCHLHYLTLEAELRCRQWFVVAPTGQAVATATAWHEYAYGNVPVVHALACDPAWQHRGLGRAAAVAMLDTFARLDPGAAVWLETQTWSWRAVALYLSLGFYPLRRATFNGAANGYFDALPILQQKLPDHAYRLFTESARDA